MYRIVIAIFLAGFFLFHPFFMQINGCMYPHDDYDYFAYSASFAFGQYPSFKNEYLMNQKNGPLTAIGSGILAAPFVFWFSFLDRINHSDIVDKRTAKNIPQSWSVFGFIFSSVFYFCLACGLLYRSAKAVTGAPFAAWAVILMAICQGMPLYAFRRPVFSHVFEFFMQSVFVYIFIRQELSDGRFISHWRSYILLGVTAGLFLMTRYNDVLFSIVWSFLILSRTSERRNLKNILWRLFWVAVPVVLIILIFKKLPENYNNYTSYHDGLTALVMRGPWQEFLRHAGHVFIGLDMGLIFTAPFCFFGFWGLTFLNVPWKKRFILAILPLVVNFYIIINHYSYASWYGYRYFIASAFPLLVLPLACLMKWIDGKWKSWWKWTAAIIALFPIMSMLCFETSALTTHQLIPQFFGKTDWANATYQISVWQTILNLQRFSQTVYLGGILYLHYLFLVLGISLGFIQGRTNIPFEIKTFIQTLLLYLLPLMMALFFREKTTPIASIVNDNAGTKKPKKGKPRDQRG